MATPYPVVQEAVALLNDQAGQASPPRDWAREGVG